MKPTTICVHCGREREIQGRSLCSTCYRNHRGEYPQIVPSRAGRLGVPVPPEQTEEELEAMIAEQSKDLPAWWHQNTRGNPRTTEIKVSVKKRKRKDGAA